MTEAAVRTLIRWAGDDPGHRQHAESRRLRLLCRLAVRLQPDDDIDAAVLEVQRVCMALRAVSDDGHLLAIDQIADRIAVVEKLCLCCELLNRGE